MATTYFNLRNDELAVQEEATYGTSPGAIAAGDFFKHTSTRVGLVPNFAALARDRDRDYNQADVLEEQNGRKSGEVSIEAELIPSGNATTPTPPDTDLLWLATLGQKHTATAHTTTAAGSSGTSINFTTGGVAASGIAVGDLFAIDVDATFSYEVRRVVALPGGDVVTVDRALSANPAASRTVKVGTTYRMSESALKSLYLWLFNGDNLRYVLPGTILQNLEMTVEYAEDVIIPKVSWSGRSKFPTTHSSSRPTPTTAGSPLAASIGQAWIGANKFCYVSAGLTVNNGLALRENESCSIEPTAVKRTENNARYMIEQTLSMLFSTGDVDAKAVFDAALARTAQSVLVQIGRTPGSIFAWATPKWIPFPDAMGQEFDGEIGFTLNGRCYGTSGDDSLYVAFI